jgi:hypothetical protein
MGAYYRFSVRDVTTRGIYTDTTPLWKCEVVTKTHRTLTE